MLRRFVYFFSIVAFSTSAYSAEVKKINEKTGGIYINEGSATGFVKGARVCLFEGEKKVACGKVVKSIGKKALVKVAKKNRSKVKLGYIVSLAPRKKKGEMQPTTSAISKYGMAIAVNGNFMAMTPATYVNIDYLAPASGNTTLWESNGTASKMLFPPGFGLEFQFMNLGIDFGFRYGSYTGYTVQSNFNNAQTNLTMTTKITGTDTAAYFDYIYWSRSNLDLGLGIDYDMTTVKLNGTQTDDNDPTVNNVLYTATSSLNVLSLRAPFIYRYAFGSFGFRAGAIILLPLVAMGPSQSIVTPTDTAITTPITTEQEADLKASLDHKKGSIGLDLLMSLFYQF